MATRKQTEVECQSCARPFLKAVSEVKRNLTLNRKNYCSLSCAGKVNSINLPSYEHATSYQIQKHAGNKRDQFTGFREHLRRCRKRNQEVNINLDDLKQQWDEQNGICPYTGLALEHPKYFERNDVLNTASLDRIDCNKGYLKGNVQFVSMAINYAKSTLSHEETVALCKIIAANWIGRL